MGLGVGATLNHLYSLISPCAEWSGRLSEIGLPGRRRLAETFAKVGACWSGGKLAGGGTQEENGRGDQEGMVQLESSDASHVF